MAQSFFGSRDPSEYHRYKKIWKENSKKQALWSVEKKQFLIGTTSVTYNIFSCAAFSLIKLFWET